MTPSETEAALEAAVAGLTYASETDAPWTAFVWPDAGGSPTAEAVKKRVRCPAKSPVAQQTVEGLLGPLAEEQEWFGEAEKAAAARHRSLRDLLRERLTDATVFRIGKVKVAVCIVGRAKEGGWAGVRTTAVET